jgi:hypothetical protein
MSLSSDKIIVKAKITKRPKNLFDPMPKVIATFEDGEIKELFEFYPDEIDFDKEEFIGLTEKEARRLKYKKDINYLQS